MDLNIEKSKENILLTLSAIHQSVYSFKKDEETFAVKTDDSLYAQKEIVYHDGDLKIVVTQCSRDLKLIFYRNHKEKISLRHTFPKMIKFFCPVYRKYKALLKELENRRKKELMVLRSAEAQKANSIFDELFYSSFQGYIDDILLKNKNK